VGVLDDVELQYQLLPSRALAAFTATSPPPPPQPLLPPGTLYELRTDGSCEFPILTLEECGEAARSLELEDRVATKDENYCEDRLPSFNCDRWVAEGRCDSDSLILRDAARVNCKLSCQLKHPEDGTICLNPVTGMSLTLDREPLGCYLEFNHLKLNNHLNRGPCSDRSKCLCMTAERPSPPPSTPPLPPSAPPPPSPPSFSPPDEIQGGARAIRVLGIVVELLDAAPDYLCQNCTYLTGAAAGDIAHGRYTNYYEGSSQAAREAGARAAVSAASQLLAQSTWGKLHIGEESRILTVPVDRRLGRILMPPSTGNTIGNTFTETCNEPDGHAAQFCRDDCDAFACETEVNPPGWPGQCQRKPFNCHKTIVQEARDDVLSIHPDLRLEDFDSIVYWVPSNLLPIGCVTQKACCAGGDWSYIDAKLKSGECFMEGAWDGVTSACNESHPMVEFRELEPTCSSAGHASLSALTIDKSPGGGFLAERQSDEWLDGIIIRSDHWPLATPAIRRGSRWRGALEELALPTGIEPWIDGAGPKPPSPFVRELPFIKKRRMSGDPRVEGNEPSISGDILAHFLGRQLGLGDAAGTGFIMPFDEDSGSIFPDIRELDSRVERDFKLIRWGGRGEETTASTATEGEHCGFLSSEPCPGGGRQVSTTRYHPPTSRQVLVWNYGGAWASPAAITGDSTALMGRNDGKRSLTAAARWKLGALPNVELRTTYESGASIQLRSLEAPLDTEAAATSEDVLRNVPVRAIRLRCPACVTNMLPPALAKTKDSFFPPNYFGGPNAHGYSPTSQEATHPRQIDSWVGGDVWISFHGEDLGPAQAEGDEHWLQPDLESKRNKVYVHLAHDFGSKHAARAVAAPWNAGGDINGFPGQPPFGWTEPPLKISYDATSKFPGRLLLKSACWTETWTHGVSGSTPRRQNTPHVYTLHGLTASGAPYYYSETDMISGEGRYLFYDSDCDGKGSSPRWMFGDWSMLRGVARPTMVRKGPSFEWKSFVFDPDHRTYDLEGDGLCTSKAWAESIDTDNPPLGEMSWHAQCCDESKLDEGNTAQECIKKWTDTTISLQPYDYDKLDTERSIILGSGDYYSPPGLNLTIAMCSYEGDVADVRIFDTILPAKCETPYGCSFSSFVREKGQFAVDPCGEGFMALQLKPEETPGYERFAGLKGSKANATAAVEIVVTVPGIPADFGEAKKSAISKAIKDAVFHQVPGYRWDPNAALDERDISVSVSSVGNTVGATRASTCNHATCERAIAQKGAAIACRRSKCDACHTLCSSGEPAGITVPEPSVELRITIPRYDEADADNLRTQLEQWPSASTVDGLNTMLAPAGVVVETPPALDEVALDAPQVPCPAEQLERDPLTDATFCVEYINPFPPPPSPSSPPPAPPPLDGLCSNTCGELTDRLADYGLRWDEAMQYVSHAGNGVCEDGGPGSVPIYATKSKPTIGDRLAGAILQPWSAGYEDRETSEPDQWNIPARVWSDGLKLTARTSYAHQERYVAKFPCPVGSDCFDCGPRSVVPPPLPPPAPPPADYLPLLGAKMSSNRTNSKAPRGCHGCSAQVLSDVEAANCIDGDLSTGCMSDVIDNYRIEWDRGSAEWNETFLPAVDDSDSEGIMPCQEVWPRIRMNVTADGNTRCGSLANPVQDGDSNNWITVRVPEGSRIDDVIIHNINNASFTAMLPDFAAFDRSGPGMVETSTTGLGWSLNYFQFRLSPFQVWLTNKSYEETTSAAEAVQCFGTANLFGSPLYTEVEQQNLPPGDAYLRPTVPETWGGYVEEYDGISGHKHWKWLGPVGGNVTQLDSNGTIEVPAKRERKVALEGPIRVHCGGVVAEYVTVRLTAPRHPMGSGGYGEHWWSLDSRSKQARKVRDESYAGRSYFDLRRNRMNRVLGDMVYNTTSRVLSLSEIQVTGKSPPRPPSPPPTPPPLPPSPPPPPITWIYGQVTSGRCDDQDVCRGPEPCVIRTLEECQEAAISLGLDDTRATELSSQSHYPPYCTYHTGTSLHLQFNERALGSCSASRICLCKTIASPPPPAPLPPPPSPPRPPQPLCDWQERSRSYCYGSTSTISWRSTEAECRASVLASSRCAPIIVKSRYGSSCVCVAKGRTCSFRYSSYRSVFEHKCFTPPMPLPPPPPAPPPPSPRPPPSPPSPPPSPRPPPNLLLSQYELKKSGTCSSSGSYISTLEECTLAAGVLKPQLGYISGATTAAYDYKRLQRYYPTGCYVQSNRVRFNFPTRQDGHPSYYGNTGSCSYSRKCLCSTSAAPSPPPYEDPLGGGDGDGWGLDSGDNWTAGDDW